jgi:two-component system LytT family response regulator
MKVIIIDDERNAIITLVAMISGFFENVEVVGTALNGEEGLALLEKKDADLVLLDINMPGMNGLEMLEKIEERNFKVVITSAHEKFALKAIKHKVYDYLLKPINIDELEKVIATVKSEMQEKNIKRFIKIGDKKNTRHIKLEDVYFVKADGRYSEVNCVDKQKYYVSRNIGEFEEELKHEQFFRVHKSFLVNCRYVQNISSGDGGNVEMENGVIIEISRRKKVEFIEFLNSVR